MHFPHMSNPTPPPPPPHPTMKDKQRDRDIKKIGRRRRRSTKKTNFAFVEAVHIRPLPRIYWISIGSGWRFEEYSMEKKDARVDINRVDICDSGWSRLGENGKLTIAKSKKIMRETHRRRYRLILLQPIITISSNIHEFLVQIFYNS